MYLKVLYIVQTQNKFLKKKKKDVISEAADTLYHMCVLLRSKNISINEVLSELATREGISGIEEKRKRNLE